MATVPRRSRDALLRDVSVLWMVIAGLAFLVVAQASFLVLGWRQAGAGPVELEPGPGPSQGDLLCAVDAAITPDQLQGVQAQAQAWLGGFVAERGLGPHTAAALAGYVEQYAAATSSARLLQAVGLRGAETTRLVLDKEAERCLLAAQQLMGEQDAQDFCAELTQALAQAWQVLQAPSSPGSP